MITVLLQDALTRFMSKVVAPAASRGAARFVPSTHLPEVQALIEYLLIPGPGRLTGGEPA